MGNFCTAEEAKQIGFHHSQITTLKQITPEQTKEPSESMNSSPSITKYKGLWPTKERLISLGEVDP